MMLPLVLKSCICRLNINTLINVNSITIVISDLMAWSMRCMQYMLNSAINALTLNLKFVIINLPFFFNLTLKKPFKIF